MAEITDPRKVAQCVTALHLHPREFPQTRKRLRIWGPPQSPAPKADRAVGRLRFGFMLLGLPHVVHGTGHANLDCTPSAALREADLGIVPIRDPPFIDSGRLNSASKPSYA